MQSDAPTAPGGKSFSLAQAIFAISTGEAAPKSTALDLCFEARSILSLIIDSLESRTQSISSPDDIAKSVRVAASLIEAASILKDIEENRYE